MSRGKKIWEYAKGLCTKMIKSFGIGTEFSRLPLLQGASGSIREHPSASQHQPCPWPGPQLCKSPSKGWGILGGGLSRARGYFWGEGGAGAGGLEMLKPFCHPLPAIRPWRPPP